jgi:hypothetical protein
MQAPVVGLQAIETVVPPPSATIGACPAVFAGGTA